MKAPSMIRFLLINPPLTDPTCPYHSIPYLVGAALDAGFKSYSCADANIDALNWLSCPDNVDTLLSKGKDLLSRLNSKARLTRNEQLTYRYALRAAGFDPCMVQKAIATLKHPERFYRYPEYRKAMLVLIRWMDLLSLDGFPGQFDGFYLDPNGIFNLQRIEDLRLGPSLLQLVGPFRKYLDGPFVARIARQDAYELIGLSVNYVSQLPFAVYMAELLRKQQPSALICIGGTEITDVFKYARNAKVAWDLFPGTDAAVLGEGESAFVQILQSLSKGTWPAANVRGVKLNPVRHAGSVQNQPITPNYENISSLASPNYQVWNWEDYWAPEPVILYSPTRGCYWNKCTFCDYGLNSDSPTSPARDREITRVVQDLRMLGKLGRTFYFAVDAMSPVFLKKLCAAIASEGIKIRWAAELRLEKQFRHELALELRKGGCVAISFGYESGSQRILDLINKGVDNSQVPEMLSALKRNNIGVQMMGFIGFPSENPTDAEQTYHLLLNHSDSWAIAGIGDFVLTPGAIVAKQPSRFGISKVEPFVGEDIIRSLSWIDGAGNRKWPGDQRTPRIKELTAGLRKTIGDRPFVGGIDSAHSLLYFARFGAGLVEPEAAGGEVRMPPASTHVTTPFANAEMFADKQDIFQCNQEARMRGRSLGTREFGQWLSEMDADDRAIKTERESVLEVLPSGHYLQATWRDGTGASNFSEAFEVLKNLLVCGHGLS